MYRLVLLLLCHTAAPAPQAMTDSDITYVKLQPPIEAPTVPSPYRESRIENLPLTIPGNVTSEKSINDKDTSVPDEFTQSDLTSDLTLPESTNLSESVALPEVIEKTEPEKVPETTELPEEDDSERTSKEIVPETTAISKLDEIENKTDPIDPKPESTEKDELLEAHGSDQADSVPSETYQSERRGRTYDSSETTDIFEEITERFEDITQIPEVVIPKTKPPKNFSKLSYFRKPQAFSSFPKNSIEKSPLRRFRSHCRCEKIWNCPKLQISVPRCPNEYFLCCF